MFPTGCSCAALTLAFPDAHYLSSYDTRMIGPMMLLRLVIIVIIMGLALALVVAPNLFPAARNARIPVVVGLVLLAALNLLRLSRVWQAQRRAHMLEEIPKKPLGL